MLEDGKVNPQWVDILKNMHTYEQSGMFPPGEKFGQVVNGVKGDAFLSGRLAMTIIDTIEAYPLMDINQIAAHIKGYEPVELGRVVALPIRDETSGTAANVYYNFVFMINTNASN